MSTRFAVSQNADVSGFLGSHHTRLGLEDTEVDGKVQRLLAQDGIYRLGQEGVDAVRPTVVRGYPGYIPGFAMWMRI